MNYNNIATTVFTPLEYSCVGLSEQDAIKLYGDDNVDVFHSEFKALEWNVNLNNTDDCYVKAIYNKKDKNRVVGIHILSPNSGEIMQGFSAAFNLGITKEHLDNTCSIHPTVAEELTLLKFNKKEDGLGKKDGC